METQHNQPYNQEDLDMALSIFEHLGVKKRGEVLVDEIWSHDEKAPTGPGTLFNTSQEPIYSLESLEKLSVFFNVTKHKSRGTS